MTHEDLVILTAWLAREGHTADAVAYAVEKPWKYPDELATAKAVNEHEQKIDHEVTHDRCRRLNYPDAGPADYYCILPGCDWEWVSP